MFGLQRGLNSKLQNIKIYKFEIKVYKLKFNFNSKYKKDRNKSIYYKQLFLLLNLNYYIKYRDYINLRTSQLRTSDLELRRNFAKIKTSHFGL